MRRLICTFVVRICHKTHFRMTWPISFHVRTTWSLKVKRKKYYKWLSYLIRGCNTRLILNDSNFEALQRVCLFPCSCLIPLFPKLHLFPCSPSCDLDLCSLIYMPLRYGSSKTDKGHLCLWREDSLKEKYNTKYFKIIFLFNFPCIQVSFDRQKHIFWLFLLCLRPHTSAGMNIKDALLQNIIIMASYCIFYFYSHRR